MNLEARPRRGRFWPGYRWRILAHEKTGTNTKATYTGHRLEPTHADYDSPFVFDELVIDDWFHIEQMNDRDWWIGVGNHDQECWSINVHIDAAGKASVMVERDV